MTSSTPGDPQDPNPYRPPDPSGQQPPQYGQPPPSQYGQPPQCGQQPPPYGYPAAPPNSAYFVGTKTQTIGHRAVGIRVVDANTGAAIGAGRGALRWLVMGVTGAICTLGYWSPFFDSQRRQGWHDKVSNAIAIPAK